LPRARLQHRWGQVKAGDAGARLGGGNRRVARPARDIQHILARAQAEAADEASANLIEPLLAHHRVIVTRRPRGLGFLLELRQLLHRQLLTCLGSLQRRAR